MPDYQKKFTVPIPIVNFDQQLQDWLLLNTNLETLERYMNIYNLHESLVKQADECGDRKLIWHDGGKSLEIQWRSDDTHQFYMKQIPHEDQLFYEKVWDDFHTHLGTGYTCQSK